MIANSITGFVGVPPPATYLSTILTDSPLAAWLLQETSGTTAADSSGNSRNATYYNSPTLNQAGPGNIAKSVLMATASSQYAKSSKIAAFAVAPSDNWTMEAWFKISTLPASGTQYSFISVNDDIGGAAATQTAWIYMRDNGTIAGQSALVTYGYLTIGSTGTYNNGAWHYAALTGASGGDMTLYVDGVNVASTSTARRTTTQNNDVGIGIFQNSYNYLNGNIAAAAFYNSCLSSTRITAHYNAGK
jgi:hypothetical protein